MLAIKFIGSPEFSREWHVGEPMPVLLDHINEVEMIQADGDEYDHIARQYYIPNAKTVTIPIASVRVMRWCGSIAQTIIANLCS